MPPNRRRWLSVGFALAAAGLAFGSKLRTIHAYGSDVPYMDEWDAIGRVLLVPHASGTLHVGNFLETQNEHRIVFSRVLGYFLATANRQWDPLLEMTVGAAIHAAFCAALLLFARTMVQGVRFVAVALVTIPLFLLAFDWENTLQGIQSQFYLLEWGALGTLALCAPSRPLSPRWWTGLLVGVASLGTMSSGFVAGAAALAVLVARAALERRFAARTASAAGILALLCMAGYAAAAHVPGHDTLRAHTPREWIVAATSALSWPALDWPLAFLVLQLPVVILIRRCARSRSLEGSESVLVGLAAWVWMQTAIIAFGRANEGMFRSPRYMDLYAVGSFANALALAVLWRRGAGVRAMGALSAAWVALFACGLWTRTDDAHRIYLDDYPRLKELERLNVRGFLATGDASVLWAAKANELPYPLPGNLGRMLSEPGIRSMLPMGIRPALHLEPDEGTRGFSLQDPSATRSNPGARVWVAMRGPARFVSRPLPQDILPFIHLAVAGSPGMDASAIRVETAGASESVPLFALGDGRMHSADVAVPPGRARLVADVPEGGRWLAFSEPVEVGRGSWFAHWLLRRSGPILTVTTGLFAALLLALALVERPGRHIQDAAA